MNWKTIALSGLALAAWASMAAAWVPPQNHYLCHQVKDLKLPKFIQVLGIPVSDQTGPNICDAKKPYLLCNPVDKGGSGIVDNTLHYCCYKVKCSSKPVVAYSISDQFGNLQVQTKKPKFLCNPCDKF